jgi:D-beta-D-heptose 7-phosphate kinase/D-beta-D-heptose 1-phosphate adenosyltransferase
MARNSFRDKASNKIISLEQASNYATLLRDKGSKIGNAGGFFDLLHVGHIRFLQYARENCDKLFVHILNDSSARFVKGCERPIIPFAERVEALAALECVDVVIPLVNQNRGYNLSRHDLDLLIINTIKPTVLIRTQDAVNEQLINLKKIHKFEMIVLPPTHQHLSTTSIIQKIRQSQ